VLPERLLKTCGRKHNAQDTHETLRLLRKYGLNYSFDLLFALPSQTAEDLDEDLAIVSDYAPPHLSAYCLTVPEGHPMSQGRAPENEQIAMFVNIERELKKAGLYKYEISNFAKPGFESRHNGIYWNDQSYWGLGLSAHSYNPDDGEFGLRFWNPKSLAAYEKQSGLTGSSFQSVLPPDQWEQLKQHEAMTDFSHMHLRTMAGMPEDALHTKFPALAVEAIRIRLERLKNSGWVELEKGRYRLTSEGQLISNKAFEELTFLASDSYCAV